MLSLQDDLSIGGKEKFLCNRTLNNLLYIPGLLYTQHITSKGKNNLDIEKAVSFLRSADSKNILCITYSDFPSITTNYSSGLNFIHKFPFHLCILGT